MFEHRSEKLASRSAFVRRMTRSGGVAAGVVLAALLLGVSGYHFLERLPWIDALLNASMILGGMGPIAEIRTVPGKLFASFYALFSGLVFIAVSGILFAPLIHRFLHKFHLEGGPRRRPPAGENDPG